MTDHVQVQGSLFVLPYSNEDEFVFKNQRVIQTSNSKIDLSLLIEIKQTQENIEDKFISVDLNRIYKVESIERPDGKVLMRQKLFRVPLKEIDLVTEDYKTGKKQAINELADFDPEYLIKKDKWNTIQLIKLNIAGIPVKESGYYAVTLSLVNKKTENDKKELLCCAYLKVDIIGDN